MAETTASPKVVCIFAHNEEARIGACLSSLPINDRSYLFFVVVNGSTDRTFEVADAMLAEYENANAVDLKPGGKSRSWNTFVHELAPRNGEAYFFIDGDAVIKSGSLEAMTRQLAETEGLNAVAAPPLAGRRNRHYLDIMIRERHMFGGLYALDGDFVRRIVEQGHRLPEDLIGDDGMIGSWAKTNLGRDQDAELSRLEICTDAGFYTEEISLWNPWHLRMQFKRMVNYSERRLQNIVVSQIMKSDGVKGLPALINPVTARRVGPGQIRRHTVNAPFDWLALKRIRRKAAASPATNDPPDEANRAAV